MRRELLNARMVPLLLPLREAPRNAARFAYYLAKSLGAVWAFSTGVSLALNWRDDLRANGLRRMTLWSNRPLVLSLVWIASMLALLTTSRYYPPRYVMPMAVPLAILSAWLVLEAPWGAGRRLLRPIYAAILTGVLLWHGSSLAAYVARPDYSYRDLARIVVQELSSADREPYLLGRLGCLLALETGGPAVSEHLGHYDLETKLRRHDPTHLVTVGEVKSEYWSVVERHYRLELGGVYDLYRNYQGEPVYLYRLHPLASSP